MEASPLPAGSSRRGLFALIAAIVVAAALGLLLQHVLSAHLESIQARSQTDLPGARAELARIFELSSVCVFGLTGALGVMIVLGCRRSLESLEFPPQGLLSWGRRRRIVTGPAAKNAAYVGIALGVTLIGASAAGGGLLWYMAQVLRACRAGIGATGR